MLLAVSSLVIGAILAVWLPVRQFLAGLLVVAIASVFAVNEAGYPLIATVVWGAISFCLAQVGYGCGLALLALGKPRNAPFGERFASRMWRQQTK